MGTGEIYDRRLHEVVETKAEENYPEGAILEVVKSGYIYKNMLLKRAEVVVNTTGTTYNI